MINLLFKSSQRNKLQLIVLFVEKRKYASGTLTLERHVCAVFGFFVGQEKKIKVERKKKEKKFKNNLLFLYSVGLGFLWFSRWGLTTVKFVLCLIINTSKHFLWEFAQQLPSNLEGLEDGTTLCEPL